MNLDKINDLIRRSRIDATARQCLKEAGIGYHQKITSALHLLINKNTSQAQRFYQALAAFNHFTEDNDPYEEHDCAIFEFEGERVMFKVDYFDKSLTYGSPDPKDTTKTCYVMTLMLAEEY